MHVRGVRPQVVAAVLTAVVAAGAGPAMSAQSGRAEASLPTPAQARRIAQRLWDGREAALATLSSSRLRLVETASARAQDESYFRSIECACEPAKARHAADRIIPQVPRGSVEPVFFAQIHTVDDITHKSVWYVVAVERVEGRWKIAFVDLGVQPGPPPLRWLTNSDATTAAETADVHDRIARLARNSISYATSHTPLFLRTGYGATVRRRFELHPSDGVFGLAISSGQVLSCFTIHSIEVFAYKGGLVQGAKRKQWGHLVPPGVYRSITIDAAAPQCVAGSGADSKTGVLRFNDEERMVAESAVRL